MRTSSKIGIVTILIFVMVPAWLYASGNLPQLFAGEERLIRAVHQSCPRLTRATFKTSRLVFENLRRYGVRIPYTYNERLARVKTLQDEVIKICNSIILDR